MIVFLPRAFLCSHLWQFVVGQLSYSSSTPAFSTGKESESESEKTSKIDKGNYLHQYTPRFIAPDTVVYIGNKYNVNDLGAVNGECKLKKVPCEPSATVSNDNLLLPEDTGIMFAYKEGGDTLTISCPFKNNKSDADTLFVTSKKVYVTVKSRNEELAGKTAGYFELVKDASTLKENDSILIVATKDEKSYVLSSTGAIMGGMSGKEVTIEEDGTIKSVPDGATPLKLKAVNGKWALNTTDKNYFYTSNNAGGGFDLSSLIGSGSENKLRHGEIAGEIGDSAQVSIAIEADGLATITMRGDSIMLYAETAISTGSSSGSGGSGGEQGGSSSYNMSAFNCFADASEGEGVKIYRFQDVPYFDITVGKNGWLSIISAKNVELPEGLTAYTAKEVADDKVYLEMVDEVKAEIPYILKGSKNTTYTLTAIEEAKAPEANQFQISTKSTGAGVYVLDSENAQNVFYKWDDALLGSGHVYLNKDVADEAVKALTICGFIGDANCDGKIDVADIVEIVNSNQGKSSDRFSYKAADVTMDGKVNDDDIEEIVKIIMGSK